MQISGIAGNGRLGEADRRIYLKPESSAWSYGAKLLPAWDDLAAEVRLVLRVGAEVHDFVTERLEYAIGLQIGSALIESTDSGQRWRPYGAEPA